LFMKSCKEARNSYSADIAINARKVGKLAWWQITDCDEPDNLDRASVTESRMTC
jgi:hypothetical protein